jgi:putative transcriptional regulator
VVSTPSLRGRLLVATPVLRDGTFDRTVILLLEHGDDGAVGVVLNRPSDLDVGGPLPEWRSAAAEPGVVFVGGPVAQGGAICLGRAASVAADGWEPVVGAVGVVDLSRPASDVLGMVEEVRVFTGYAGWGGGQLEGELQAGAWLVLTAEPGDALSADPESLWRTVLRRQPGPVSWLANYPEDPSLN